MFDTTDLGSTTINDYCQQYKYGQHKKYVYQNTKFSNTTYSLTLNYTGDAGGADFNCKYDSIYIEDFLIIINNPNWGHYHKSIQFEGNTFYAVSDYENGTLTSFYTIYYTAQYGVIRMVYKSGATLTLLP